MNGFFQTVIFSHSSLLFGNTITKAAQPATNPEETQTVLGLSPSFAHSLPGKRTHYRWDDRLTLDAILHGGRDLSVSGRLFNSAWFAILRRVIRNGIRVKRNGLRVRSKRDEKE